MSFIRGRRSLPKIRNVGMRPRHDLRIYLPEHMATNAFIDNPELLAMEGGGNAEEQVGQVGQEDSSPAETKKEPAPSEASLAASLSNSGSSSGETISKNINEDIVNEADELYELAKLQRARRVAAADQLKSRTIYSTPKASTHKSSLPAANTSTHSSSAQEKKPRRSLAAFIGLKPFAPPPQKKSKLLLLD